MRDPEDQLADLAATLRRAGRRARHLWRRSPPGQVQQGVARRPRVFQVLLFAAMAIGLAAFAVQALGGGH